MKAGIYCRVSTDSQEAEGTSLQTQIEACLKYCQDKGYEVAYHFTEAYSGLTLERPKLNELRELIRNEQIDLVVVYCLDRLSRDPAHGVILTQELEKHGVRLEAVTEDVDNSELGKLISYIRGFASKLEAEKLKERTVRGRHAKAKEGKVSGAFHNLYGYDYIPVSQKDGGGRRVINENEAKWVPRIFEWLVNEGLTTGAIRDRLIASNAPTKMGKTWCRGTVIAILKNPAYAGKTYAFTTVKHRQRQKPQEEWIELPGVTPAIISEELFEAAQKQLQINQARASRNNKKREYLLRSHVRCHQCGHAYTGGIYGKKRADGTYRRAYLCAARSRDRSPLHPWRNKVWSGDRLEALVWTELERYLSRPELIISELERQRQDANQLGIFEAELERVKRQLKAVDREQHQLLQWALKGFPESQVETENKRLNKAREALTARKAELEAQVKACQEASINVPNLEQFIGRIQAGIANLNFEGKRQALDMLNITVWIDGHNIEVTGVLPVDKVSIATTHSI